MFVEVCEISGYSCQDALSFLSSDHAGFRSMLWDHNAPAAMAVVT